MAAVPVGTIELLVVLLAQLRLVSGGYMLFLLKFVFTVGECTLIAVRTFLVLLPAFAEFGLDFELVVLREDAAVTLEREGVVLLDLVLVPPGWPNLLQLLEVLRLVLHLVLHTSNLIINSLSFLFIF